jgi:glycosyltransferase involved in cell wall biosynthesis
MPASPLRVAVVARAVLPLHGFGGLERSVRDLVRHLAACDVHVTLIVPPARQVLRQGGADPFAGPRITVKHVPYITFPLANRRGTTVLDRSSSYLLYGMRAGRAAGALVDAGDADIVHGFGASVLGYARRRKPLPAPLVFNPQGLEEFGATAERQPALKRAGYTPLRWAVRRCARAADCIIATDVALEPTVAAHLRPAPGQMRTVPNGIDLAEAMALAGPAEGAILRQRRGIGAGDFVLLSAGRLERNKGFDDLATALAEASREGGPLSSIPWRWIIVGAGPQRLALERQIGTAGLSQATFTGKVSDAELHAWYEAASVFVHPTRYEGSSLVTLEAMAHSKAVIGTRAGGLPDKVKPGLTGWLVEPGDVAGLTQAIGEAAAAGTRLTSMGEAGRELVEREFAWTVLAPRQIAIYRELLQRQ